MGISVPSSPSQSLILQVARVVEISSNITLSGLQTIDGVTLVADERVLLTAQSDGTQNGLWKASAGAWSRPSDYESGVTVESNIVVPVSSGSANADTRWQITTDGTIVVDTTSTTWAKTDLGITAVVDDTSPQLGGNLDLDSHSLVRGSDTVLSTTTDGDAIHPNDVGIGAISDPARKLEILDASNPHIRLTQTDGTDYTEIGTIDNDTYIGSPLVNIVGSGSVHSAFIARGSGTSCFFQAQHSTAQSDNVNSGLTVGISTVNAQINNRQPGTLDLATHNRIALQVNDYPSGGSSVAYQPGTVPAASFPDNAAPPHNTFPADSAKTVLISTGSVQLPTLEDPEHVGVQYVVMNTSGSTLTGAVTTTGTVKMYDKNNTAGVQTTDIDAYSAKTFVFIELDKYVMVG